ncbi:MAG: DUF3313 family protein [Steroidobacteraceae bacterium]|nr:DUF3313 family protein [Steroidobacteraceae bacterium]
MILRGRVYGIANLVSVVVVCVLAGTLAGCAADRKPEETTPDGLVRVPSRAAGGVYRAPGAPFFQYKRFIIEPLTVDFIKDWQKTHREVSDREVQRIRNESRRIFLDEFTDVLIEEGGFTLADEPAEDVLLLAPALTELDVPAPENDTVEMRSLSPRRVSMTLTGELRDSLTGKLVGRIIMIEPGEHYGMNELRPANRVTNAHEIRLVFDKWVRLLRETLSVASTARPRVGA